MFNSRPVFHSPQRIYHMKAVCGGGKSYAMLKHIREDTEGGFIYAVPTIALADEIEKQWRKESAASSDESLRAGELTVIHSRRTPMESAADRRRAIAEILLNPFAKNTVLITHELLLGDLFDPRFRLGELIGRWHIIIDEDPEIVTAPGFQDNRNVYTDLGEIVGPQCIGSGFSVVEVSTEQRERVRDIATSSNDETRLDENVRALCTAISDDKDCTLMAAPSQQGFLYYLARAKPLAEIVAKAGRVTILASHITGLTRLYLNKCGIEICDSEIRPAYSSYPTESQGCITVWRVWDRGNMSKDRLIQYGVTTLLTRVADQLSTAGDDSNFLLRANNVWHQEARKHARVHDVVSKVTKGLNGYGNLTAMVDIASYNRNSLYGNAYGLMDQLLEVGSGTWQAAVEETHAELSAQAAFRIGIRRIHDSRNVGRYSIVLPDRRTEDFVRATYLPDAIYRGAILDDGRQGKSPGRPTGVASDTAQKVAEVTRLIQGGARKSSACAEAGLSRPTYDKYCDRL